MNANHRGLAKFETPNDANYRSLRNRLVSTVQQIREGPSVPLALPNVPEMPEDDDPPAEPEPSPPEAPPEAPPVVPEDLPSSGQIQEQIEAIGTYLSIDEDPDDILSSLNDTRLKGSCEWISLKPSFQEWRRSETPRYFWLKGPPASGKSNIASHIIEDMRDSKPVCYYFFKTGDKVTPNLSRFLRSMAYQMCRVNSVVRGALFALSKQGSPIDIRNQRSIWHNVFTGCVFHKTLEKEFVFFCPSGIRGLYS